MEIHTSDLVMRFLRRHPDDPAKHRLLLTVALLLDRDSDCRILELLQQGGELEIALIQELADLASPIELAVLLGQVGAYLPPPYFSAMFDRVYRQTTDTLTLRELGNAAAWYHERHPGAIDVPRELAERLLDSPDEDQRIVGLKVMRRFHPDPATMTERVLVAIAEGTCHERMGAACELTNVLADPNHKFLSALPDERIAELRRAVEDLNRNDLDACVRENAANAIRMFGYFDEDRPK